jgi:hypothetical protein
MPYLRRQPATFTARLISLYFPDCISPHLCHSSADTHKVGSRCGVPRGYIYRMLRHGNFVLTVYARTERSHKLSQTTTLHVNNNRATISVHIVLRAHLPVVNWKQAHEDVTTTACTLSTAVCQATTALSLRNTPLLQNFPITANRIGEVRVQGAQTSRPVCHNAEV